MISGIVYIDKNDYAYLETLKSLKEQTHASKEIIAVCDVCSIELLEYIRPYVDKMVAFKSHRGRTIAKNEGAERAEGEILVFIDCGVRLTPEVFSEIWNTRQQWIIGTCMTESPDTEAEYKDVFEFKNKHLVPRGDHNGIVFCKKLTFEVLGKFYGGIKDENKDLIKRFRRKGRFFITSSLVYPSPHNYVGKKGFNAKLIAIKKFFGRGKKIDQPEEKIIKQPIKVEGKVDE